MYYVLFIAGLALLAFLAYKSSGNAVMGFILGFMIYVYSVFGLTFSFFLPHVHIVSDDGTVKREFGTIPWVTRTLGAVTFTPRPDSTYIVNPTRREFIVGKVLYTDVEELVGAPVQGYDVRPDTTSAALSSYLTARVAVSREAPSDLTTGLVRGIEMVNVVSPPNREPLQSLSEGRYRLLREAQAADYVPMSTL